LSPPVNGWRREKETGRKRLTRAAALKRNAVVAQAMKKPGKTKISEEDWNRYLDAVRRKTSRAGNEKQAGTDKENENDSK
jgi:hypothetical protein